MKYKYVSIVGLTLVIFSMLPSIKIDEDKMMYLIEVDSSNIEEEKIQLIKNRRINNEQKSLKTSRGGSKRKPHYNLNDLTEESNITKEQLETKLEGTPLYDVAGDYILAEKEFKVNAIFLCALSILESGWGNSRLALNKNNIFGYAAYNSSPYSSAGSFASKSECISVVSEKLAQNYLEEEGKYYNGKSLNAVNIKYSLDNKGNPNKEWNKNIRILMKQLSN